MRSTEPGFKIMRTGVAVLAVVGATAFAAPAAGPVPAALARIESGAWQMKTVGSDAAPRRLCLSDPTVLLRYGHVGAHCRRVVTANTADLAEIAFTCAGAGHGQTTLKVATPHAFNLETQGILDGAPFDEQYEAHRLGACAAARR